MVPPVGTAHVSCMDRSHAHTHFSRGKLVYRHIVFIQGHGNSAWPDDLAENRPTTQKNTSHLRWKSHFLDVPHPGSAGYYIKIEKVPFCLVIKLKEMPTTGSGRIARPQLMPIAQIYCQKTTFSLYHTQNTANGKAEALSSSSCSCVDIYSEWPWK